MGPGRRHQASGTGHQGEKGKTESEKKAKDGEPSPVITEDSDYIPPTADLRPLPEGEAGMAV